MAACLTNETKNAPIISMQHMPQLLGTGGHDSIKQCNVANDKVKNAVTFRKEIFAEIR